MAKPIEDHNFAAVPNKQGLFIGRVREFPDLRTRPHKSRLDALDDIIAMASEKIRDIDAALS